MKQGEIWNTRLDPIEGREQGGIRPTIILSGDDLNDFTDIVIICPLTTSIKKIHKCLVIEPSPENNLRKVSQVLPFQIRSISKERLINKIGNVDQSIVDTLIDDLYYFLTND